MTAHRPVHARRRHSLGPPASRRHTLAGETQAVPRGGPHPRTRRRLRRRAEPLLEVEQWI